MSSPTPSTRWFGVRSVFLHAGGRYEERVVIVRAQDFGDAMDRAEREGAEYVDGLQVEQLGLAQAFAMFEEPEDGAEVFSLVRDSDLDPASYLTRYFDTGSERQQTDDED